MRYWLACLCLLIGLPLHAADDDDFWLYLDQMQPKSSLDLGGGAYEQGGQYADALLHLALLDSFYVEAGAQQQNLDSTTDGWNAALGNGELSTLEWQLGTDFWGETDVLETRNNSLFLTYHGLNWSLGLGYESGELRLFTTRLINQRSTSLDHQALHYRIDWLGEHLGWGLEVVEHDYEKDLRGLNLPLLQYVIKPAAIDQASALALRESRFYVDRYFQDDSLQLSFSRIQSAVTRDTFQYASVTYNRDLNPSLDLSLNLQLPLSEGVSSAGINLILSW